MKQYLINDWRMNNSQASRILHTSRGSKYYKKKMPFKDAPVCEAIKEVTKNNRRGRVKVIRLVQRAHPQYSSSRIRRVYERGGFVMNNKIKKRVVKHASNPIALTTKPNEQWAIDMMSDALIDGRKVRTLNMIDHYNRLCVGIAASHNMPAVRVIEQLERAIEKYGKPAGIRTDNGPEFTSKRFQLWLHNNEIEWIKIPKGRPDQNAIIERFNRSYREDVLDANVFKSIDDLQQLTDKWVMYYNTEWPHQSLNYKTPNEYAAA